MRHNRYSKLFIAFVTAALMMFTGAFVYADDDTTYFNGKDGKIKFQLPYGSEIEEHNDANGRILSLTIPANGKNKLKMDLYYTYANADTEYYSPSSKKEAEEYYEELGVDELESLYTDREMAEHFTVKSIGDVSYYQAEYMAFASVMVRLQDEESGKIHCEKVYITASTPEQEGDVVNMFFFFSDKQKKYDKEQYLKGGTYKELEHICLDGFYDYGYDSEFLGGDELFDDWDFDAFDYFPIWTILLIAIVLYIYNKTSAIKRQSSSAKRSPMQKLAAQTPSASAAKAEVRKENTKAASGMREVKAETDAEARYYDSLQTLLKSGLVTKEELSEILEKHEERKEWMQYRDRM